MATSNTKPWYASKTLWGLAIAAAALIAGALGQDTAKAVIEEESIGIASWIEQIAVLVGFLLAFIGRLTAKTELTGK